MEQLQRMAAKMCVCDVFLNQALSNSGGAVQKDAFKMCAFWCVFSHSGGAAQKIVSKMCQNVGFSSFFGAI